MRKLVYTCDGGGYALQVFDTVFFGAIKAWTTVCSVCFKRGGSITCDACATNIHPGCWASPEYKNGDYVCANCARTD